ncbi:hypothetical protein MTO96_009081 [Rhipicephalus appendiculatus]
MLRHRLVCGVRDETLQRRLLAETALDFKKAYEKALAAEYATRQTAAIRGALPAASDLHQMAHAPEGHKPVGKQDSGKQSMTRWCTHCNGDHDATSCGFRYSVCHFCKWKGDIVRACHQKEAAQSKAKTGYKRLGKSDRSGVCGLYHIASALPAFMATNNVNERTPYFGGSGLWICLFHCQLKDIEQAGNLEEGAPTVFPGSADLPCSRVVRSYHIPGGVRTYRVPGECGPTHSSLFESSAKWKFLSNTTVERVNYPCSPRRAVKSASWGETGCSHRAYLWKDCTSSAELQFLIVPGEKANLLHATRARW